MDRTWRDGFDGAFCAFIPVGIRIGLDAREEVEGGPARSQCDVLQTAKSPCPCVADGVMIATQASPGQGTLQISPQEAPPGLMAMIIIRNRKTGEGLKYTISDEWLPAILGWNKSDPPARFDAAMAADSLFNSLVSAVALPHLVQRCYDASLRLLAAPTIILITVLRRSLAVASFHSFQNMLEF